jgi:hypothetical protein
MNRGEILQQLTQLCRSGIESTHKEITPSGCKPLDAILPGGGWQSGTVVELMPEKTGIGELQILMPALARITQTERHVAFVSPPFIPFAPSLSQHGICLERLLVINAQSMKDMLWCVEQTLRCKSFGAVLAWPTALVDREIRRLQLAAETGSSIGFVYRPTHAARETSPAAVRICLQKAKRDSLEMHVLKCRGARGGMKIVVSGWRLGVRNKEQTALATGADFNAEAEVGEANPSFSEEFDQPLSAIR